MNLVLKEVVLQVSVETTIEWFGGRLPVNRIREFELSANFDWDWILRG